MTTLYFVRHAHSTYTPDEVERPLSEKGYSISILHTRKDKEGSNTGIYILLLFYFISQDIPLALRFLN